MNIDKIVINRDADHHVIGASSVTTENHSICVRGKEVTTNKTIYSTLYVDPNYSGTGPINYCIKEISEDEEIYTPVAICGWSPTKMWPVVGDTLLPKAGYPVAYRDVIKIFDDNTTYTRLDLNNEVEPIYFISSSLTNEEKEELEKLTDIPAHEVIWEYLESKNEGKIFNINSDPTDMNISGEPGSTTDLKVIFDDPNVINKITWFDWSLKMLDSNDEPAEISPFVISNKTKQGCTITCPSDFPEGVYKMKMVYVYKMSNSNVKRRVKSLFIINGWDDPVIMVWDESTYNKCNALGMITSPATKDPDNFEGCRDLTKDEMVNEVAMRVAKKAGWLTRNDNKIAFLKAQGMPAGEAEEFANKFMSLREAKAVTSSQFNTKFLELFYSNDGGTTVINSFNPYISTIASTETANVPNPTYNGDVVRAGRMNYNNNPYDGTHAYNFANTYYLNKGVSHAANDKIQLNVTNSDILYTLTHFESLGYFIGLITLPETAFRNCINLTRLFLPTNLKSIGGAAMAHCNRLTTVQTLKD